MAAKWGSITAGEIIPSISGELISGRTDVVFSGLSTDSRDICHGRLFLALKGDQYDGHEYIRDAINKGACGIIAQQDYRLDITPGKYPVVIAVPDTLRALGDLAGWWRHQQSARVAVITGSAGKTTVKEMTAGILELESRTLKNIGNFNNLVGLPHTILSLEEGHQRAVLEMGMNRTGEIARLTEIADPDIGLITNVARAHLEGLGDIQGVARAKVEMIEKISSNSRIILNGDDRLLIETASPLGRDFISFGIGSKNNIRAGKIRNSGKKGISFDLKYNGDSVPLNLGVPGFQNVFNALAAAAISLSLNVSPDNVMKGLNNFEGIQGRFRLIPLHGGGTLIDDTYNSNPFSLRAALNSLKDMAVNGGRLIVGLGEMMELGNETAAAHFEAGCMVADLGATYFMAMGDHSKEMIEGALKGGLNPERIMDVRDREEMVRKIMGVMEQGDLILLKGSRRTSLEKVIEILKQKCGKED